MVDCPGSELPLIKHGFLRVAAAVPLLQLGNCRKNKEKILELMAQAEEDGISILAFPELSLTGYTCADLFHQSTLQRGALEALQELLQEGKEIYSGIAVVGLPLVFEDELLNCAAIFQRGNLLGIIPKQNIPNYNEFYELRWFSPATNIQHRTIHLFGKGIPLGTGYLFSATNVSGLVIGIEICEDLWVPIPPSSYQALAGASVLINPTASNEMIGKMQYRRQLVQNQSGRCVAAYIYVSCGVLESTTDLVFGGHCLITENASLLAESKRFQRQPQILPADIDLEKLQNERLRLNSFTAGRKTDLFPREFKHIPFELKIPEKKISPLRRWVDAYPFVPRGREQLDERCGEIFHTQTAGLARRLEHVGKHPVSIGISGGLDSTLALVVTCKTFDLINSPREKIKGFTMPGFGTSKRTRENALALMNEMGVSASEVDIRSLCLDEMRALDHKPFGIDLADLSLEAFSEKLSQVPPKKRQDLVFENVQARMRTNILMNAGFVIGTGDLSELALGWTTYNGDHMSMYNPNISIPKTLVKFLVRWAAENEFSGKTREVLLDVVDTKISPELLPPTAEGDIGQSTEAVIGPYELHDFFLFNFLRFGFSPEKILFLAEQAEFDQTYTSKEISKWLREFIQRFFKNQFKRSCLPDGPKVGSITLSPRGDWRMPSDAQVEMWLESW